MTSGKGLEKYDLKERKFHYYLQNEKCITQNNVYTTFLDKDRNVWIGTGSCGLIKFNPSDNTYHYYFNDSNEPANLAGKTILVMHQDHKGLIWIGTDGHGYYKYDAANNKLTRYSHNNDDNKSISNNSARSIYEDRSGTLWFGTNFGGLNKFDRKTETFEYCGFNCVLSILEDKTGNFWVADYYTGLNLYDRKSGKAVKSYGRKEGLLSYSVWGILEDDHNNLWIKTDNGLFKFNTVIRTFKHYTTEDGLIDNFFLPFPASHCMGPGGTMLFLNSKRNIGKGVVIFHPDSIKNDQSAPIVLITNISSFNQPGSKLSYKGFISEIKEITLPYTQNDLRFEYVGLQYSEPLKNQYKYTLENFDNDWTGYGNSRQATYTNLEPGEYIFKVTASNRDGVWSPKDASITIIIMPPWWKTTAAYLLYILFAAGLVYLTWKLQMKRIRIKQQYEMSRFEAEKLHEVDGIKSRFFTNISHEFRTPLTLIIGPVKQLSEKIADEKAKEVLRVVHRNADKLLTLVNQLLDISKIESGNMKLQTAEQNIAALIKAITLSFTSYAERKKINLSFSSRPDRIPAYIDKEKFGNIINNLLSNAFKFTPEGGEIGVEISCQAGPGSASSAQNEIPKQVRDDNLAGSNIRDDNFAGSNVRDDNLEEEIIRDGNFAEMTVRDDNFIEITVRDTGIGIPEEKLPRIFDRFYQVDGSHKKEHEGTGIGLALTKELIELHKGTIEVASTEGKGTIFTIRIPPGSGHLQPEEICDEEIAQDADRVALKAAGRPDIEEEIQYNGRLERAAEPGGDGSPPLLLIVEDNNDVRKYIKDNLIDNYKIIEAADGEEGWNRALSDIPELIISDVMMPKMDGFELCGKIKSDERTSHIPIILLTAKAASEDKIVGYETGADEYIMKPFDSNELKARIKNLIEQRKRIHEHFRQNGLFELDESKITPLDKKFLQNTICLITGNISDDSFNIEKLAEGLNMSRSVLHKKIVSLIGEPPVELVKTIRMTRAAELICLKTGNISEIALEVGFKNPAYFSECFKKQFGVTPSQYSRRFNH